MRRKNPKFQQIVATGKELFWKHGVKKVSVEEICNEANVSKVTYYKHFKNKIELVKYILQENFDLAVAEYREFMDSDIPFVEKVEKTIQMKMKNVKLYSPEFLNDLYNNTNPVLMNYVHEYSQENFKMVERDYRKAQKEGHIRADVKIEFMMFYLNKMIELAGDPNFSSIYDNPHQMIGEITNFFFYGVVARNEKK